MQWKQWIRGFGTGNREIGSGRRGEISSHWAEGTPPANCAALCAARPAAEAAAAEAALREAFPLLPLAGPDAALLRRRRCTACRMVTRAMAEMRARAGVFLTVNPLCLVM